MDDHQKHLEDHIVSFLRDLLPYFLLVFFHRAVVFVDNPERSGTLALLGQRLDLLSHVPDGGPVVEHLQGNYGIIRLDLVL